MPSRSKLCAAAAACVVLALSASNVAFARQGSAPAANPVAAFNDTVPISGTKDLTPELFPALAAMEAPPQELSRHRASLMTSGSDGWSSWESWAKGEKQQAVLAALKKVTDPKAKLAFSLKYGANAADSTWVKAGLYIDLGKPELLAAADHGLLYMTAFDRAVLLCTVEAERLASQNKPKECIDVLVSWIRFARTVADRPFAEEKIWAYRAMIDGLERMRDIACLHRDLIRVEDAKTAVDELDLRAMLPERITFPRGERQALQQLMAQTMEERGGVKPGIFAATMAGISSRGQAMSRFARAGYWAGIEAQHAGWFDTRDQIEKIYGDWEKRWNLNNMYDPYMDQVEDWTKTDLARFAMVHEVLDGVDLLFDLRAVLQTELTGTRTAMAVVGYRAGMKDWPPALPSVQPRFIQKLDADPWFYEPERKQYLDFRYFVPIRDEEFAEREEKKPRPVRVNMGPSAPAAAAPAAAEPPKEAPKNTSNFGTGEEEPPASDKPNIKMPGANADRPLLYTGGAVRGGQGFEVGIDQTEFILYSVGPDGKAGYADSVGYNGSDVLIWPPLLNLERRAIKDGLIQAGTTASPFEGISLRIYSIHLLEPIAGQVFDKASGKVDMPKLRELWTAAVEEDIRKQYSSESKIEAVNAALQITSGMDPSMLLQTVRMLVDAPDAQPIIERDAKQFGLSATEVKELVLKANEESLKSKESIAMREKVKGGAKLTADDLVGSVKSGVDTLTQPAFEPYLRKILEHYAAGAAAPAGK